MAVDFVLQGAQEGADVILLIAVQGAAAADFVLGAKFRSLASGGRYILRAQQYLFGITTAASGTNTVVVADSIDAAIPDSCSLFLDNGSTFDEYTVTGIDRGTNTFTLSGNLTQTYSAGAKIQTPETVTVDLSSSDFEYDPSGANDQITLAAQSAGDLDLVLTVTIPPGDAANVSTTVNTKPIHLDEIASVFTLSDIDEVFAWFDPTDVATITTTTWSSVKTSNVSMAQNGSNPMPLFEGGVARFSGSRRIDFVNYDTSGVTHILLVFADIESVSTEVLMNRGNNFNALYINRNGEAFSRRSLGSAGSDSAYWNVQLDGSGNPSESDGRHYLGTNGALIPADAVFAVLINATDAFTGLLGNFDYDLSLVAFLSALPGPEGIHKMMAVAVHRLALTGKIANPGVLIDANSPYVVNPPGGTGTQSIAFDVPQTTVSFEDLLDDCEISIRWSGTSNQILRQRVSGTTYDWVPSTVPQRVDIDVNLAGYQPWKVRNRLITESITLFAELEPSTAWEAEP
ncbi:MAG: hypothetical protein AAFX78_03530 [Cyanobacteria bacterium J06638_20]